MPVFALCCGIFFYYFPLKATKKLAFFCTGDKNNTVNNAYGNRASPCCAIIIIHWFVSLCLFSFFVFLLCPYSRNKDKERKCVHRVGSTPPLC